MKKFESSIYTIPFPQTSVYAKLADLTNLDLFLQRTKDPAFIENLRKNDDVTEDQIKQMQSLAENMELTPDSVTLTNTPLGTVAVQIIEREEPKCVKLETVNAPIKFNIWTQIVPTTPYECKIKCTIGADINIFMEQMMKKPLQEAVERIAKFLTMIPYGY